ncbi:MAG: hypothetical protein SCALA702_15250 [Melioribacteraceae bacterium]|nr:MAG: hypothetical protein SCALA702_15250 [Melioribacteraceae bacterium]
MKRVFSIIALLAMIFGVTAFQCSSTEITSAKLYIQQENLPKAKEVLLKEIEKNPKSDEGFFLLGYVNGQQGDVKDMMENYKKSLEISSKFKEKIDGDKLSHWADNFNKGVGFYNRASKANTPDSTNMYFEKAITHFGNAIDLQPDSLNTYQNLIFTLIQVDRSDEAIPYLETLIEKKNTADNYVTLGEIYSTKGAKLMNQFKENKNNADSVAAMVEYNNAIGVLERGREAHPDNSDVLLLLSNAYIAADKMDVAMDAFKAGVEKEPDNQYYRYNYGVLLLGANMFSEAADQFEKAVDIDPDYTNALYNLGVTYIKWGTEVREEAEAAEQEDDSYKGMFEKALPALERYLEMKPEEPAVWELVGKIYANLGMNDKSMDAYNKADQYRN